MVGGQGAESLVRRHWRITVSVLSNSLRAYLSPPQAMPVGLSSGRTGSPWLGRSGVGWGHALGPDEADPVLPVAKLKGETRVHPVIVAHGFTS